MSEESRRKMSLARLGTRRSEETKAKMRLAARRRWKREHPQPELEDPAWLRSQYVDDRCSISRIAKELGCTPGVVRTALRRHGIRPRGTVATHGMTQTPTFESWTAIRKRCDNPRHAAFNRYGGRGITLCRGWRGKQGFANFYADMGERPPGLTLDRIDNDGGYWCGRCEECNANGWPANCRWTDWVTQNNNRRPRRGSAPRSCPHCSSVIASRGFQRHVGVCQRDRLIGERFMVVRSRRLVAEEFGVGEQVVKRAARRYRERISSEEKNGSQ